MTAIAPRSRNVIGAAVAPLRSSTALSIGLGLIALHLVLAILAPVIAVHDPVATDSTNVLAGPEWSHWLGTDQYGRDILSRTLNGGRYALLVTFLATTIAVAVGTVLGAITAYADNWFDEVVMRVVDALLSVPSILALLVVVTVFDAGLWVIVLAVTIVYAPAVTRVVRGAARTVITQDYVTAARARGEKPLSIVFREILPNVLDVVLVEYAMRASWIVLLVASLSFLGFGANPPTPDWGLMVQENRTALTVVPLGTLAPIVALATLVIGLNLAADGLAKSLGVDRATQGATSA
ncbi:peptide/nickel transport system permease protein [Curtobacterium sp. PhB130]|uniref:ABC transporter permease n=1 Tax=unclassified Curtobacterium TaxID=257496 RepID=UPI000F4AF678|nr:MULTISPECIES: ABC transporter permease [unclassified Curtobacterium]ROP66117.1 peptide/nickel transport system permease protein [Curtobacterium sp. ZW137]ROS73835.1 peptide/nickel transport system permease protein [Curtobacterium sp. PhB130]TCK60216.1 peptide/nickel transport system permease protein [Curtobacterium sp. PhB136]